MKDEGGKRKKKEERKGWRIQEEEREEGRQGRVDYGLGRAEDSVAKGG